jgi:arylsulfatase
MNHCAPELPGRSPAGPRNLLLITFDQWRGDWCDPARPVIDLPNLHGLAERGHHRRGYAPSPQCVPARLSWLSGLPPSRFGVTTHRPIDVPAETPSIFAPLRAAGFHTELVGKSHWTAHVPGRDLRHETARLHRFGFDRVLEIAGPRGLRDVECELTEAWREAGVLDAARDDLAARYDGPDGSAWRVRPTPLPNHLYPDLWLADRAVERVAALPPDRPWFLWVSFVGPHEPFDTPPPWAGRHRNADLPPPRPAPPWLEALPANSSARRARERWGRRLSPDEVDAFRRDYADRLSMLDEQVGRLLDALDRRDDADTSDVVVTADHGELLGDGGMLYKGTMLEATVRVAWIERSARPIGGTAAPAGTTDLLAAHVRARCGIDHVAVPDVAFVEHDRELMAVRGDRKVVLGEGGRPLWACDLAADPEEMVDLQATDPARLRRDPAWSSLIAEARRAWRRRHAAPWKWWWRRHRVEEVPRG